MELRLVSDLTEDQLRYYLDFDDSDIDIENQTQYDFIIICHGILDNLPYPLYRHIKCVMDIIYKQDPELTIFIFLH